MDLKKLLKLAEQYEKLSKTRGKTVDFSSSDNVTVGRVTGTMPITTSAKKVVIDGDLFVTGTIKTKV